MRVHLAVRRGDRRLALALAVSLLPGITALSVPERASAASVSHSEAIVDDRGVTGPVPDLDAKPFSAPVQRSVPAPAATGDVVFPDASTWELSIQPRAGERVRAEATRVDSRSTATAHPPVSLQVAVPGKISTSPALQLRVFGRATSAVLGANGFAFELGDLAGQQMLEPAASAGQQVPAEITVDYSGFAGAYGADFGGRLVVMALPACAFAQRAAQNCLVAGRALQQRNLGDGKIVVDIPDLAGLWADSRRAGPAVRERAAGPAAGSEPAAKPDAAMVFVVTSSTGSEQGTFSATDLSQASQWQVALGTGEFSWSHSIRTPAPGVGKAPEVSLGYSSAAVDGMTNATSTQGSTVGVGWGNSAEAYIERTYESCADDKNTNPSKDLCYPTFDRPVLSLGGVSGRMVRTSSGQWRLETNPDWKIEQLWNADNRSWNGEHWKLTASDGTQYWFGLYKFPEAGVGSTTHSVAVVPTWHPFNGQPCNNNNGSYEILYDNCTMAWRWGLDRVIDRDGNVTVYRYELPHNRYLVMNGLLKSWGAPEAAMGYNRALRLKQIEYGGRIGVSQPTARVVFNYERRCRDLDAACAAKPHHDPRFAAEYPDVPVDLVCPDATGHDSRCVTSPSFFEEARLANVQTDVFHAGAWLDVDWTNVYHAFALWDSNRQGQLNVNTIQRNGVAYNGWVPHEPAEFGYQQLQNRVDTARASMMRWRLSLLRNEFDGEIRVTYGRVNPCPVNFSTNRWDQNTRDCFPQHIDDHGFTRTGAFNKYVVTEVQEDPKVVGWGGPLMSTRYVYGEPLSATPTQAERHAKQAAWRFNEGSFGQDTHDFGWTNWRGYATVQVHKGGPCPNPGDCGVPVTRTVLRLFRGMEGDRDIEFNPRSFSVTPLSGPNQNAGAVADSPLLAGRSREEQRIGTVGGQADQIADAKLMTYETREIEPPATGRPNGIRWAGASATRESVATAPGQWRHRQNTTTYNSDRFAVATTESGWLDVAGDERCTATGYAANPARHIVGLPATAALYSGACGQGQPLSYRETLYDGLPLGQIGEHARATKARVRVDQSGTFAETTTQYDPYGRHTVVTDAMGRAMTTARTANPAHGIPYQTVVTNALTHRVTTQWLVQHTVPDWVEDSNGNRVTYKYDPAGRVIHVWASDQDAETAWPAYVFGYDTRPAYRAIQSMQLAKLNPDGTPVYESTWNVYDGFWRLQQSQYLSPQAGHIVIKRIAYNTAGQIENETLPTARQAEPGRMNIGWAADNYSRYKYDDLGRRVSADWFRDGQQAHSTVTEYGPHAVTVTGPDGGKVRTTADGLGRNVEVAEWDGQTWAATTYSYDVAGNLRTATDPAGNTITNTYNLAGLLTVREDPDRGHAEYTYNLAGQQTSAVDALGKRVFTVFDQIGRVSETRLGAITGELVGKWEYDTAPNGIGALARETSHTPLGQWVSSVNGYDDRGRPTSATLTVPSAVPGVSGSYTVAGDVYDVKGRVIRSTVPAVGGLPSETITHAYNNLGLHTSSVGAAPYIRAVDFDSLGRTVTTHHGGSAADNYLALERVYAYDRDQRLTGVEVKHGTSGGRSTVYRSTLTFSKAGSLTAKEVSQTGAAWRECYRHDVRNRLNAAFSMSPGSDCAAANLDTGEFARGPQPFEERYIYTNDGKLAYRTTELHPDLADLQEYVYPTQGGTARQPHAPLETGGVNDAVPTRWNWDTAGNLASRTRPSGTTETFAWDGLNRLASHTAAGGQTTFTYSASGERLTRRAPNGTTTVYLLGHEVTVNTSGQVTQAVRGYGVEGRLVAIRTLSGLQYTVTDEAGSLVMAIRLGTGATATRSFNPYGDTRQRVGDFTTDRGFLGNPEDSSTGLSYLGARYYDASAAVFTQADPMWSASSIKSLNPYTYGFGNPTTYSDPSGLYSSHSFGLEMSNWQLGYQNKILMGIIGQLEADISHLQGVIRDKDKQIRELIAYARQLESYISELESYVRHLEGVVAEQARYIAELEATVARQAERIRDLEGQVAYYRTVVDDFGFHIWGLGYILFGIYGKVHSFGWDTKDPARFGLSGKTLLQHQLAETREELDLMAIAVTSGVANAEGLLEYARASRRDGISWNEIKGSLANTWATGIGSKLTHEADALSAAYDRGYAAGLKAPGKSPGLGSTIANLIDGGCELYGAATLGSGGGAAVATPKVAIFCAVWGVGRWVQTTT